MVKNLKLKEEDTQFLFELHNFIYLDAKVIFEYIYNYSHMNALNNRLKKLEDFGYIKSLKVNIKGDSYSGAVYTLDKAGIRLVEEIQGESRWQTRWTNTLQQWYFHNIYIARVYFSFRDKVEEYDMSVRFVHETNAYFQYGGSKDENSIRPDGFIVLSVPDMNISYVLFLEMERSYTNKSRIIKKLNQYETFLNNDNYTGRYFHEKGLVEDVEEYMILFIGLNEERERYLKRIFNSILPRENESISNARPSINIPVKLTSIDDIENDALGEIYNDARSRDFEKNELF